MITLAIVLAALGLATIVFALATTGSGKAGARRLEAVKNRHGAGDVIETQLKRISAARATKFDVGVSALLPNVQQLKRRLEMTGRDWTLSQYATASFVLTIVAWLLLFLKGLPLLLTFFLGLLIGLGLPHKIVGRMVNKRATKFIARFPDAIELLVRGLRSGLPISETLGVVAQEVPGPVGEEFRGVTDKMRIGRTMEAALQDTADRLRTPEFQFFVVTLAIQRETGGNLAETLANLSDVLRKRMQMKLKIRAMSSESKASAYIIGALPFVVFALIYFVNPDYMGQFFKDTRLIVAACGGAVWMSIGAFIMAKMVNFEI